MKQHLLDVAGVTDRGVKRGHNEDAWAAHPPDLTQKQITTKGRLYVVADGVGGHLAGDVASAMSVEIIQQRYYANPSPDVAASLIAAIQAASDQISQAANDSPKQYGMSTTVTAVVLRGNELTVANVGDSRTYLIPGRKSDHGHARQLTTDHSWVEEQVQIGLITREEAAKHPQRNIITRSLGCNQELKVDIFEEHVEPGDWVLLCSDGLSNMVSDPEIGAIVSRGRKTVKIANELIELAKLRGAPDNVTAVLLGVKQARSRLGRLWSSLIVLGLMVGSLVWVLLFRADENKGLASPLSPLSALEPGIPTVVGTFTA